MDEQKQDASRLLQLARRRDPAALAKLLEAYRNYLRLLAQTGIDQSMQGKLDPSDLVQETLLKAHQRFEQFQGQGEAELAVWLRQILANTLVDIVRRFRARSRQVSRERSLHAIVDRSSAALENLLAKGPSPSAALHGRDLGVVLADALAELSPDQRQVIVLHNLEERDWDQVALAMGRSQGAVRMLWTRALKQLRPKIEERL